MIVANVTNSLARLMHFLADHWTVVLLVVGLLATLVVTLFKGFRRGFRMLVVVFFAMLAAVVARAVGIFIKSGTAELIRFAVAWGPTVLFALIVGIATLVGVWRGLHKSLVLAVQAMCVAAVCITLFFVCVNSRTVDAALLRFVNLFLGKEGLQGKLNVSAECATLKEVFAEYIPTKLDYGNAVTIVLYENGAYLMALVDMAFRIVIALLLTVLYFFFVFILYIIYLLAYPERKYKARKQRMFAENRTDCTYKKHPIGGGLVGLTRGLCAGLITMSLLGGVMYAVAGGRNSSKVDEAAFGDRDNLGIAVYQSIEEYGDQGIFKFLNGMCDADDSPYYLFAADLIFSGRLTDETLGIDQDVKLLKELNAYTEFAKSTVNLLIKYGGDEVDALIAGGVKNISISTVANIMAKPAFQIEFENLIDAFEAQTYIINLAMSAVNTIIANIDDVSFASSVSESNREILKLLFKKGYLCERIPDDAEALLRDESRRPVYPYINFAKMFDREDAKVMFRIVTSFLQSRNDESKDTLALVRDLIPQLQKLSIVRGDRKDYFDPVYGRLYCYMANRYLVPEGEESVRYDAVKQSNVSWSSELTKLIDVAEGGLALYDTFKQTEGETLDKVFALFDEDREGYAEDMARYDAICAAVTDSRLLGNVLSTGKIREKLQSALSSISENLYIPKDIAYMNTYNEAGELVAYGELHNLLYGMRSLGDKRNEELVKQLTEGGEIDTVGLLDDLAAAIKTEDEHGTTLSTYITESVLLRSVLSATMIDNRYAPDEEHKDNILYIPALSLETDANGQSINLIKKDQLKQLFDALCEDSIMEIIRSLTDEADEEVEVGPLLQKDEVIALFEQGNGILEGTIANLLITEFDSNEYVVVPSGLQGESNLEKWISYRDRGELAKILRAIKETKLDLAELMKGKIDAEVLFNTLAEDPEHKAKILFDSQVIHYSVSKLMLDGKITSHKGFSLVVPHGVAQTLKGEDQQVIAKKELITLFTEVAELELKSDSTQQYILKTLVAHKDALKNSEILSASLANYLFGNENSKLGSISVPQYYKDVSAADYLKTNGADVMQKELIALVDALEIMFAEDDYAFDGTAWGDKIDSLIPTLNKPSDVNPRKTNLQVFCSSGIVLANLSKKLEEALERHSVVDADVIAKAKDNSKPEEPFTFTELQALVYVLNIFDINNISGIDGVFADRVKGEVLSLNDPYENGTKLSLIYPSVIVQSLLADKLDAVITPNIENNVLTAVKEKGENGYYPFEEIEALINGVKNGLGYTTLEEITDNAEKYSDLSTIYNANLDEVCASDILSGILTKAVKESIGIVHTDLAYKSKDMPVYRVSEFETLIELTEELGGGSGDLDTLDVGAVNLKDFSTYIYNSETNTTASYLLAATVSFKLLEEETTAEAAEEAVNLLVVPYTVIWEKYNIITPKETALLIDAFALVGGTANVGDFSVSLLQVPKNDDEVKAVLRSTIMRANITQAIVDNNNATKMPQMYVSEGKIEKVADGTLPKRARQTGTAESGWRVERTTTVVLSIAADELRALFNLFNDFMPAEGGEGGTEFSLPSLGNYDEIKQFVRDCRNKGWQEEDIFAVDMIRYRVSAVLLNLLPVLEEQAQMFSVYDLRSCVLGTVRAFTAETLLNNISV